MIRMLPTALIVFCCGCGPSLQPITGTVVFEDGRGVPSAIVEFKPMKDGKTARGKTDSNGKFGLVTNGDPGAMPGDYQVIITQVIVMDGNEEHLRHARTPDVAAKYRSYETSGLTQTIGNGTDEIEILVESQ